MDPIKNVVVYLFKFIVDNSDLLLGIVVNLSLVLLLVQAVLYARRPKE